MRADARGFWPFRGLNALFGRKFVNFPIAYCSDIAYRSVGADAHIGPLGTNEFAADFRENGVALRRLSVVMHCTL